MPVSLPIIRLFRNHQTKALFPTELFVSQSVVGDSINDFIRGAQRTMLATMQTREGEKLTRLTQSPARLYHDAKHDHKARGAYF